MNTPTPIRLTSENTPSLLISQTLALSEGALWIGAGGGGSKGAGGDGAKGVVSVGGEEQTHEGGAREEGEGKGPPVDRRALRKARLMEAMGRHA